MKRFFSSIIAPLASRFPYFVFFLLALFSVSSSAVIEEREFANLVEKQRYQTLIEELRCPKCQNQNIADSDAEIAEDLRNEIYRQLRDGKSDQEIVAYLVSRYGEFVNYRPPLDSRTLLLWSAPGILLLIGLIIWLRRFAAKQSANKKAETVALSAEDQQRLNVLLESASQTEKSKQSGESS
jgi:cytochrome c-type biogenesis protein CcmH